MRHPWEARDWQSGQPWTDAVPGGRAWGLGPGALSSPTHVDLGMGRQDQYLGAGRGAGGEGSPGPRLHGPSAVGAGNPSGGRGATQPHQTPRPHPSPGLGPLLLSTMVTWATSGAGSGVLGPTSQLGARPGTAVGLGTGLRPRRRPATGSRLPRCSGLGVGKAGGRGFAERPPGGGGAGQAEEQPQHRGVRTRGPQRGLLTLPHRTDLKTRAWGRSWAAAQTHTPGLPQLASSFALGSPPKCPLLRLARPHTTGPSPPRACVWAA